MWKSNLVFQIVPCLFQYTVTITYNSLYVIVTVYLDRQILSGNLVTMFQRSSRQQCQCEFQADMLNIKNFGQGQVKGNEIWVAMKTLSGESHSLTQSCIVSIFHVRGTSPFSGCLGQTLLQIPRIRIQQLYILIVLTKSDNQMRRAKSTPSIHSSISDFYNLDSDSVKWLFLLNFSTQTTNISKCPVSIRQLCQSDMRRLW